MKNKVLFYLLCLFLSSCSEHKETSPVVGVVRKSHFTIAEAQKILLKSDPAEVDLENIITRWIDDELLYQAALESNLNKDKTIRTAVADYERRLLGMSYLKMLIQKSVVVVPSEIEEYYTQNQGSFLRPQKEVSVLHFLVQTKKEAGNLRSALIKKGTKSSSKEFLNKYHTDPRTVKKKNLIQALAFPVFSQKRGGIVGPIQTEAGYHVLHILEIFPKGSLRSLVEVYDEIQQQLIRYKSIIITEQILDSLRHTFQAEILLKGRK